MQTLEFFLRDVDWLFIRTVYIFSHNINSSALTFLNNIYQLRSFIITWIPSGKKALGIWSQPTQGDKSETNRLGCMWRIFVPAEMLHEILFTSIFTILGAFKACRIPMKHRYLKLAGRLILVFPYVSYLSTYYFWRRGNSQWKTDWQMMQRTGAELLSRVASFLPDAIMSASPKKRGSQSDVNPARSTATLITLHSQDQKYFSVQGFLKWCWATWVPFHSRKILRVNKTICINHFNTRFTDRFTFKESDHIPRDPTFLLANVYKESIGGEVFFTSFFINSKVIFLWVHRYRYSFPWAASLWLWRQQPTWTQCCCFMSRTKGLLSTGSFIQIFLFVSLFLKVATRRTRPRGQVSHVRQVGEGRGGGSGLDLRERKGVRRWR